MIWSSKFIVQSRNTPGLFLGEKIISSVSSWLIFRILVVIQSLISDKHASSLAAIVARVATGLMTMYTWLSSAKVVRQSIFSTDLTYGFQKHAIKLWSKERLLWYSIILLKINWHINRPQLADICYWERILSNKKHNEIRLNACNYHFIQKHLMKLFSYQCTSHKLSWKNDVILSWISLTCFDNIGWSVLKGR